MPGKPLVTVIDENAQELMSIRGVVGIGEGLCDQKPCIKIFVDKMTPELKQKLPQNIDGYQVDIVETGKFKALDED